jgi:hypothetical protein
MAGITSISAAARRLAGTRQRVPEARRATTARRPGATREVKVWGLTNGRRGLDSEDIDEERLDVVEREGSRGDEEVEDGEEVEQHPGWLPFKVVLLPPQQTALLPADGQPRPRSSPLHPRRQRRRNGEEKLQSARV